MPDARSPVTLAVHDDGVAVVRLADPAHRNALSTPTSDALAATVADALGAGAAALVLTADPPAFCAGGDLDGLLRRDVPLADSYAGLRALAAAPVPTIAAVAGAAVGAGVTLALACDVVLAGPAARFDPRFLDLAIHPGGALLWRLTRRVGRQGAAALVLCGDVLTGEEAVTAGLAWRCLPAEQLEPFALTLARRAASRPGALVRRTKQTLDATAGLDAAAAFDVELAAQEWSVRQPEFEPAVRAVRDRLRGS